MSDFCSKKSFLNFFCTKNNFWKKFKFLKIWKKNHFQKFIFFSQHFKKSFSKLKYWKKNHIFLQKKIW